MSESHEHFTEVKLRKTFNLKQSSTTFTDSINIPIVFLLQFNYGLQIFFVPVVDYVGEHHLAGC